MKIGAGEIAKIASVDVDRLRTGDREVFVKVMADLLACAPSKEEIETWAKKYPDRYFYAMKLVAGMMGLSEKVEYSGTIFHAVVNMSDAELMKSLDEMKISLDHPMKNVTRPA